MEENHLGETKLWAESLIPPLVSWAAPGPTSVGCRGRDGGATACATDSGVRLSLPSCTRSPTPQEAPGPQISLHEQPSGEGGFTCSCGAMVARLPGSSRGVLRDRRLLQRSVGLGSRRRVPTRAHSDPKRSGPGAGREDAL